MSALTLTSNSTAVAMSLSLPISANGGTPPYTYSIQAAGAGGLISPTGIYTSPPSIGIDTVIVVDSLLATAQLQISVMNPTLLVCDIIQSELALAQGRVYLWDQKIGKSTDSGLYVVVGVLSAKPFASGRKYDGSGPGLNQITSANFQATLSIDIMSRGPDARDRKEEIILALESNYSQSQQELNSFYIARISSAFQNLSEEDGSAIPYRFNISVMIQYSVKKTKAVSYYNTFPTTGIITDN